MSELAHFQAKKTYNFDTTHFQCETMNYFLIILEPKGSVGFLLVLSFFFPFPFY